MNVQANWICKRFGEEILTKKSGIVGFCCRNRPAPGHPRGCASPRTTTWTRACQKVRDRRRPQLLRFFIMCLATTNSNFHGIHFTRWPESPYKCVQILHHWRLEKTGCAAEFFELCTVLKLWHVIWSTLADTFKDCPRHYFFSAELRPTENPCGCLISPTQRSLRVSASVLQIMCRNIRMLRRFRCVHNFLKRDRRRVRPQVGGLVTSVVAGYSWLRPRDGIQVACGHLWPSNGLAKDSVFFQYFLSISTTYCR